jgi:hypothetical protein
LRSACRLESKYRVVSRLQNQYPHLDIRCVDVRFKTRGAAETLFILLQRMSALELTRKTLSVDCHTLFRRFVRVSPPFRQCGVQCHERFSKMKLPCGSWWRRTGGTTRVSVWGTLARPVLPLERAGRGSNAFSRLPGTSTPIPWRLHPSTVDVLCDVISCDTRAGRSPNLSLRVS